MNPAKYENYSRLSTWDECIERLYLTKEFADFKLVVVSGIQETSFAAHSWILCMASPVFNQMVCDSSPTHSITINDVEPKVLELMLSHIYKRKIQFESVEQAVDVLSLAIRYELTSLKEISANHVDHNIDAKNACYVYQRTLSLGHEDLFYKSFKFIHKETSSVLTQSDLKNIKSSTLEDILKQDHLNIDSEAQLFETVIEWAKAQLEIPEKAAEATDQMRNLVKPFLKYIRFLCLSQEKFAEIQNRTRIFTKDEAGDILMKFNVTNWSELPEWFNQCTTSRKYETRYNYNAKPRDISLVTWSNLSSDSKELHPSERVTTISSKFIAKDKGFFIRRFVVSLCEECLYRNQAINRKFIKAKIVIKAGDLEREGSFEIPIPSDCVRAVEPKTPELDDARIPLCLMNEFDRDKLIFPRFVGLEAPIVRSFSESCTSGLTSITDIAIPNTSKTVEVVPPIYVKPGETFVLSIETNKGDSPFYSCRKKPLFDNAPFTAYNEVPNDVKNEYVYVWCAFATIHCFMSGMIDLFTNK